MGKHRLNAYTFHLNFECSYLIHLSETPNMGSQEDREEEEEEEEDLSCYWQICRMI